MAAVAVGPEAQEAVVPEAPHQAVRHQVVRHQAEHQAPRLRRAVQAAEQVVVQRVHLHRHPSPRQSIR